MKPFRSRSRRPGFTLVEVLLVLVILVFLFSMAVAAYGPIQRQWKISGAKAQVGLLKSAVATYEVSVGSYPPTLEALRRQPADAPEGKWHGPYLDSEIPKDPWDRDYQYQYPGQHNPGGFDVWSSGPQDGTQAEIGNW